MLFGCDGEARAKYRETCGMNETTAHEEEKKKGCLVNHIIEKEANSASLRECLGPSTL